MLLDFGLARLLTPNEEAADRLTRTGAILGTPHYMAPEQLFGDRSVDHRADIWAVGVIAYECLSGKRPIEGKSYGQVVRNAARVPIRPIHDLVPHLPRALADIIGQMLSHDREGRPSSLASIHEILVGLAHS